MALFHAHHFATKQILDGHLFNPVIKTANILLPNKVLSVFEPPNTDGLQSDYKPAAVDNAWIQTYFRNAGFLAPNNVNEVTRRFIHSEIRFPNLDDVRREETLDPTVPARDTEDSRRASATAIFSGVGGMFGLLAAKKTISSLIEYKWIPADQQALGSIEIKLNEIPEGEVKTYEWRGKPLFVAHRTAEDVARERSIPMNQLRDPQKDEDRVLKDEWLVVVGVCTHLGCVPIPNEGEHKGGYYCPCHGSHYDASGRIRKGPAPTNLEVPEYAIDGDMLVVGGK